ncbi:peptidase U35 phage prohead [Candidatus Termititenax aidoneus]|uniref:Peptidase U35 phage prohead n=1 Tax=Termititenax aidoneus TaxID=2218524 RepID=A0A388TDB6_TERA1|nr:peptidase U35 phage prohead [Candidatus Termititenax aidoneus]
MKTQELKLLCSDTQYRFEVVKEGETEKVYHYAYASVFGSAQNKNTYGLYIAPHNGQRVFNLERHKANPVMLADHIMQLDHIMGTFIYPDTKEDTHGLAVKFIFMDKPQTDGMKHAIEAFRSGHARTLSINGIATFGDPDDENHITAFDVWEISGVAVPADNKAIDTTVPIAHAASPNAEADRLKALREKYGAAVVDEIMGKIKKLKEQNHE